MIIHGCSVRSHPIGQMGQKKMGLFGRLVGLALFFYFLLSIF
jgi:hypothetical protein